MFWLFVLCAVVIVGLVFITFLIESAWSLVLLALIPVVVVSCARTDTYKVYDKESNEREHAEWKRKTTPRPLSSTPDGCTVYVFTTDRDHYFTKCGDRVSTETTWKESCGKNCSREKSDVIVTEGNK